MMAELHPPALLNDDGSASMATALMMSHHAFRRDLGRFAAALARIADGDASQVDALREEWTFYRNALHGHHHSEDTRIFPDLRERNGELRATIDRLTADHQRIDPLLAEGDQAMAALPRTQDAHRVLAELRRLLDTHLALEEAELVPFLRDAKSFPEPANDEEANLYAQGFAWSSNGIAPEVLAQVDAMVPERLRALLPAARAAFDAKCERLWSFKGPGRSRTPVPET